MFTPSFAAGDARIWIVIVEASIAFVVTGLLYGFFRMLVLTPVRVKLNRYPRFLRGWGTIVALSVFVLLFASFYSTAVTEVEAKEAYQAEQKEKLYQSLRPVVERANKIINVLIQETAKNSKNCPVQIDRNEE
ncbi:MAG: hypothetical protein Q7S53_00540 [bacterium]|nr:hypothetical protein [bacterium]